jgi:hypothetical protein
MDCKCFEDWLYGIGKNIHNVASPHFWAVITGTKIMSGGVESCKIQ